MVGSAQSRSMWERASAAVLAAALAVAGCGAKVDGEATRPTGDVWVADTRSRVIPELTMPAGSMVDRAGDTEIWNTPNYVMVEIQRIGGLLPRGREFHGLPWCDEQWNPKLVTWTWTWGDGHDWLLVNVSKRYEKQKPVVGWSEVIIDRMVSDEKC